MTTRSTGRSLKDDRKFISGRKIVAAVIYILFCVLMVIGIANKQNYHVDELLSYGLANNHAGIGINFEDGVRYTAADDPIKEYLTVNKDFRFDYKMVWDNQKNDVHPPLYYLILNTICSFFPGSFSRWYAGAINIVFALLLLFVLRKTFMLLIGDEYVCDLFSLGFVLSSGFISAATFLRMYIMAMFWAALLTYIILKRVVEEPSDKKGKILFYVKLFSVALCGAMTHYYCIMFTVFICAALSVFWLVKKNWRSVLNLIVTGGLVAGAEYLIFPAFIDHMFSGTRGSESLENMKQTPEEYWKRLKDFTNIVDKEIGGSVFVIILAVLVMAAMLCLFQKIKGRNAPLGVKTSDPYRLDVYTLMLPPVLLYFLFVAKTASYMQGRYMFPSYAVLFTSVIALTFVLLNRVFKREHAVVILMVLLSVICVNEWKDNEWEFLYKEYDQIDMVAKEHTDTDAVFIYKGWWHLLPSYVELQNYRSVTYVKEDNLQVLDGLEIADQDQLIVFVPDNDDARLNDLMQYDSKLTTYDRIGHMWYATSYYVHS